MDSTTGCLQTDFIEKQSANDMQTEPSNNQMFQSQFLHHSTQRKSIGLKKSMDIRNLAMQI